MALTNQSDLFGSAHESGLNAVIRQIMRQRPSLFNYATREVAESLNTPHSRLCAAIDAAKAVIDHGDPLVSIIGPLPVPGLPGVGLNCCVQLTRIAVDFQPQQIAVAVTVAAGIGWPADFDTLPTVPATLAIDQMKCFSLDVGITGHLELTDDQTMVLKTDGVTVPAVQPDGVEAHLALMLRLLLQTVILPKAVLAVGSLRLPAGLGLPGARLVPSHRAGHTFAIATDRLCIYADLEVEP